MGQLPERLRFRQELLLGIIPGLSSELPRADCAILPGAATVRRKEFLDGYRSWDLRFAPEVCDRESTLAELLPDAVRSLAKIGAYRKG
jgi:hypothetical protein